MERTRTRSIHGFIVEHVDGDPRGIARRVAQAYGISRQAANRHLDALVDAGVLDQAGHTRAREYALRRNSVLTKELRVTPVLQASRVWDEHAAPIIASDRAAVREAARQIFNELVDNALEHAMASWISLEVITTARRLDVVVSDDGRGIFAVLAETLGLRSPREAADAFVVHARDRSIDSPVAQLTRIAQRTDAFSIDSSGWACEFDSSTGEWTVREEPRDGPGTSAMFRLQRGVSRERADAALMRPRSRRATG